jgi:hypothetical protein
MYRSAYEFCVPASLCWPSRSEMEGCNVCFPTSLFLFSWPQSVWLRSDSKTEAVIGRETVCKQRRYFTSSSTRGGADQRVRSHRWGSPPSPSLATNRQQPRELLWRLLKICTSSLCYTPCSIFTLYAKIKQHNNDSEGVSFACLLYSYIRVYAHLMLPFTSTCHMLSNVSRYSISRVATFLTKNTCHDLCIYWYIFNVLCMIAILIHSPWWHHPSTNLGRRGEDITHLRKLRTDCQTTQWRNPEDHGQNLYHRENLKSDMYLVIMRFSFFSLRSRFPSLVHTVS